MLEEFRRSAAKLGKRRVSRGGLDFETVEARVQLDAEGHPTGVTLRERTVATNMIEEAMIAANEVVARHMRQGESPMVYRIHEEPDADALTPVAVILAEFDYPVKDVRGATPRTFQRIITFAHDAAREAAHQLAAAARAQAGAVRGLSRARTSAWRATRTRTSRARSDGTRTSSCTGCSRRSSRVRSATAGRCSPWWSSLGWIAEHSSTMEREAEWAEDDSDQAEARGAHGGPPGRGVRRRHQRRELVRALRGRWTTPPRVSCT